MMSSVVYGTPTSHLPLHHHATPHHITPHHTNLPMVQMMSHTDVEVAAPVALNDLAQMAAAMDWNEQSMKP